MAIIVGLEEKERILKSIEEKIKEVEELNAFLAGIADETNTVMLTCVDQNKKRHRVLVKGNYSTIGDFVKEQREELVTEITILCQANAIALNDKEQQILHITEQTNQETQSYPLMEQNAAMDSYEKETGYAND